jgi:galactitol-specific phosphotransferase system IIB component
VYKEENVGKDIMGIDFENNIARPALHQVNMGGGNSCGLKSSLTTNGGGKSFSCNKLNVVINRKIKNVFKHYGIKVNKNAIKIIINKCNTLLSELIIKFHKVNGDITLSKAKIVFGKYKIMKNDI